MDKFFRSHPKITFNDISINGKKCKNIRDIILGDEKKIISCRQIWFLINILTINRDFFLWKILAVFRLFTNFVPENASNAQFNWVDLQD